MTLTVEQQRIVEGNLGLVRAVLSRCVSSPGSTGIYSYDDLFQIGCIALCEAVIEYHPGRAVFSTYALQRYATGSTMRLHAPHIAAKGRNRAISLTSQLR